MTKEVKTGMMAFIVLVAAMAVFLFVRPKDWFDGNYFRMTASFSSVQGIKKGNEVRYAGVRVGEVSKISTEGNEGILDAYKERCADSSGRGVYRFAERSDR